MESADSRRWSFPALLRQFTPTDSVDLALKLTLCDLLLQPIGNWVLRPCILSLAVIGLMFPVQLRQPPVWFALTGLTGLRVILDWPLADNHAYLLSYWCCAVSLALVVHDTRACLALNGRLLIGLAFAFATLWKLLSPDYLDGRFFRVIMLTDDRFEGFVQLVGGVTPDRLDALRSFIEQHVDGQLFASQHLPSGPARFLWLARFATLWTIALEGLVAVAFLWPLGRGLSLLRDGCLITFCATTYAVAPVEGFGWLLIAMGVAQCEPERGKTRLVYLTVFGLILFYRELLWAEQLLELVRTSG